MKQPFVSIIVLNLNDEKNTINCLKSLEKIYYPSYEVILVDNGSDFNSFNIIRNYIKKLRLKAKLIRLKQNVGFAEGNNVGIRASKANYIALLSNDTLVDKNWLREMVKVMEEDKKIALVGSEINNIGGFYKNERTLGAIMNVFGEPLHIKSGDKSFTFLVSGCSMLFKKSLIKEPFDKDYFAYGEDVALSWLVHLRGYETKIAYKSKLDHLGGVVRKRLSKLVEFHGEKNKLINIFIFYESKTLVKLMPLIILNIFVTLVVSILKARFVTRVKSYFWLIKNYKKIIEKRRKIQEQRKFSDKEILKNVSCHSPYTNNSLINKLLEFYCFVFMVPILELKK